MTPTLGRVVICILEQFVALTNEWVKTEYAAIVSGVYDSGGVALSVFTPNGVLYLGLVEQNNGDTPPDYGNVRYTWAWPQPINPAAVESDNSIQEI